MSPDSRLLILLVLSPFLIAFIHALLSRGARLISRPVSRHAVVISAIALGHIPVFLAIWFFALRTMGDSGGLITAIAYSIIVYEAVAYSYFHIFNMSETARRIRILYDIHRAQRVRAREISVSYSPEDMLDNRLRRLTAMKQVRQYKGRYFLNSRFLYCGAALVSLWARLLGLPSPRSVYKKKGRGL